MSGLFFAGLLFLILIGISGTSTLSYSSTKLTWSHGESMPTKRLELDGVLLDNKIYIIGGSDEKGPTDLVDVYDPEANSWAAASPLPIKLDHVAAATHDGKIYVVGGFGSNGAPSNSLFIYDPVSDKWHKGKNMPTARGAPTSQFINDTLYVIGGDATPVYDDKGIYNPQGDVATNEAYTPKNNSWSTKSPMPTSRDHLASAAIDGDIYVIGGRQPEKGPLFKNLGTNEMYDSSQDRWISKEKLPTNRSGMSAAVVNGSIYVLGGESTTDTYDNNERYDPTSNSWTIEEPMLSPRHGIAAVAIDDKIYVIAGGPRAGGSFDNANDIFHVNQ
jgi:N-acetylneuraminic acid mutarotase